MLTRLHLDMKATGKGKNRAQGPKNSKAASGDAQHNHAHSWQAVRRKKVERARKLLQNSNYPGAAVTKAVARLLAKNLQKLDDPRSAIGI